MPAKSTKKPATASPAILPLEAAARHLADTRAALVDRVEEYNREAERLRQSYLPGIRLHATKTAAATVALLDLVSGHPDLFTDPRSMTMHGIKFGFQKGKGKILWDDADKVVERIRAQLPRAQAEALLRTETSPIVAGLTELDATTLKKLGCSVFNSGDTVFAKAADSDVDKFVDKFLATAAAATPEA